MTLELNRIHNMPCADMFAALPEQAALIVADPPYGINYKTSWKDNMNSRRKGKGLKERKAIEQFQDTVIDTSWIPAAYSALKTGGAMYLFTRWDVLHHWHVSALQAGFKVIQCIVWDKGHFGAGNLKGYGSQTENILVCVKGAHRLRWDKREGNVWHYSKDEMLGGAEGGKHPTQKPLKLLKRIITYSSDTNDLILDPFTGSGAACIAAQRLHRRFVGCDISPTFATAAQAWLEDDARTNSQARTPQMFGGLS